MAKIAMTEDEFELLCYLAEYATENAYWKTPEDLDRARDLVDSLHLRVVR